MRSRHADLARKVGVSLAAAYVLATGSAFAQQGPGWRPGLLRQPTADTRFKISGDDPQYQQLLAGNLPQTTPPFVPSAAPNDFATTH